MLDIQVIRDNPDKVSKALAKRGLDIDFTDLLDLDQDRRKKLTHVEELKAKRNTLSDKVGELKRNHEDADDLIAELKDISNEIVDLDAEVSKLQEKQDEFMDALPNMPDDDIKAGGKENNEVLEVFGEKTLFSSKAKSHIELTKNLGLIDYERGAKLSGTGYWVYTAEGSRLEWALLNYFIDAHIRDGYEFMLLPHILNAKSGYVAGQFPKFKEDVFWLDAPEGTKEENKKFLLPTAETALVNLYRDEILSEDDLPKKFCAYTPCYRREAGAHGAEERGMIRGHQFNKVEMFQFVKPEDGEKAFKELVNKASKLVGDLGLHYRISKLAAEDTSASMARTYDIEVWIPSMDEYKEVSSVSLAREYQARRGNIRYRDKADGKTHYVYTLNGSGLATSRLFPAILEQYQQEDGSVKVPAVLVKYLGGKRYIGKDQ